jgi:hypothetical protein
LDQDPKAMSRLIVIAAFEAPTVVSGLDDIAVVG